MTLPESFVEGDRGSACATCCKDQLVLADSTSSDADKNDLTGVYMKKGTVADTIAFTMETCDGVVVSNQGDVGVFPNDSFAVGFIFDWLKFLNTHCIVKYNIKVDFTIAGIVG